MCGPSSEWHWTSENPFPFFAVPQSGHQRVPATQSSTGPQQDAALSGLLTGRENRGFWYKGSCSPGTDALRLKGSWALFLYHQAVLMPRLESRAALRHAPFCRKLSWRSTPTMTSPVTKQLGLKIDSSHQTPSAWPMQHVGAPRVTRQGQMMNLKQMCACLAWSKAIHPAETPRRKWEGKGEEA